MRDPARRLWFYVPVYPLVSQVLEEGYSKTGVEEWSAEPGRVKNRPDDADVVVDGNPEQIANFRAWLEGSGIIGLMIEGRKVP